MMQYLHDGANNFDFLHLFDQMSDPAQRTHQFTHSNTERRASVVYGSVGKQGLFLPKDFVHTRDDDVESTISHNENRPLLGATRHNNRRRSSVAHEIIQEERDFLKVNNIAVNENDDEEVASVFEGAITSKRIHDTTATIELISLIKSSVPLVMTFLLQNSLSTVSVFTVGHLGAVELAAVSMGSMTANITGYATIQGIATALDTLCPQAFGAKKYHLVGDYMQKCIALIFVIMLPVLFIWIFFGYDLITLLLPDKATAKLAAAYLKYLSPGIPAYILFECGKRFLQSQGVYHISTYVLLFAAPSNLIMNVLFVKKFGYLGAPIAVAINYWLMFLGLLISTVYFVEAESTPAALHPLVCWNGLDIRKAFKGWKKLVSLAVPGLIMLEAEFLAFEILTLMASYLGTLELAAQSVGSTMASLTYQVPFAIGIASSTRIANFLGAGLGEAAKKTTKVALSFGLCISIFNFLALYLFQGPIANLFTNDERVIALIKQVMWLVALMQISDAMNANSAGCLRGQGQTKIGGIVNLVSYYVVGIPLSIYLSFYSPWKGTLHGLWIGSTVALTIIGSVQSYYALSVDFEKLCDDARKRTSESHTH
ncbi:putative ethionine resistance-conferring protein [Clavispora lusitaniae]|uniref:Ethionine resistance-conferring protein n=1 Tax=Clavispora lusitaniae TaxID=36911 RepID=A0ACD0WLC1_CLALS|nr:putative ethionine resistance-conferring protein [Clavispora lusitaniae]QFZ33709.1 putative ethionine resistance-conferring protein [Clavispora lusitaniae]QFZ39380.1 putative ethionine resistance-conferring protein [Clavispora lusitaniae]QFZ39393.1 putative ethionine resistance-conferring protein [Clavispora lusitaniae]QFZ45062.1 putative ethionine resistance-conferring protein [Clavispora lusitaniae]